MSDPRRVSGAAVYPAVHPWQATQWQPIQPGQCALCGQKYSTHELTLLRAELALLKELPDAG